MASTACSGFFAAAPMRRREFLRAGSLSLVGLGLPQLLEARAGQNNSLLRTAGGKKAKAAILLFMWGGPLPPFVSMMPEVPKGAPRFVESSHGKGAGWLGPVYGPMQINADASKQDYQVADFNLHADVPLARTERRRELLHNLDTQLRRLQ